VLRREALGIWFAYAEKRLKGMLATLQLAPYAIWGRSLSHAAATAR
jgi:hypothetical protein